MKTLDRRRFCSLAAIGTIAPAEAVPTQSATTPLPSPASGTVGAARAIPLEQMQERKTAAGESWAITNGTLPTGETVNLHQSMQVAGAPPVQLHVIRHSEFILVREGDLEFQHEADGKVVSERVTAGGVLYIPFGTRHAVRNVGTVPARYFVVGIGGDAK